MHTLYMVSGLSGVGKTYFGRHLAEQCHATFVDQDSYYLEKKPLVRLSNGDMVKNWDCLEAVNWQMLEGEVMEMLKSMNVVLVGFALREAQLQNLFKWPRRKCIHLIYDASATNREAIDRCKASRLSAKRINKERDALVVEELVYPFYLDTLNINPRIDCVISTFRDGERKTVEEIYDECHLE